MLTVATGVLQRLTRHAGIDTEPTWSPTGQQIAFVSDRAGQPRIYVMDKDGANAPAHLGRLSHAAPLVAEGRSHHLHAAAGTTTLGDQPGRLQPASAHERSGGDNQGSAWSPDGRHIAFQSNRNGRWQLFLMSVDGTMTTQVTQGTTEATSPSWSPRLP